MIAIGTEYKSKKGSVLLARDQKSSKEIYYIPDEEYPVQKPTGRVLDLVDPEFLLKNIFKKFGLNKEQIKKLIKFYEDSENISLKLDDWKVKQAFHKLEQRMLNVLKTRYKDITIDLQPYHDPDNLRSLAAIAASNSGKSYQVANILLRPEFFKRKLYILTPNANDSSLQRLKARGKKTVFIDLNKITSPLSISSFPVDSLVLYDDILEGIPRGKTAHGFDLRQSLLHLANTIMTRGRHHKSRGGPGMSLILVSHILKGGNDTKTLYTELQGGLYVFPSGSPHTIIDFLKTKIGFHKNDIERILDLSAGSRFICFRLSKPQCAIWSTGVYLL